MRKKLNRDMQNYFRLKFIAHSCFKIVFGNFKVVIDPYDQEKLEIEFPANIEANLVTISHEHFDHSAFHQISGNPSILRTPVKNLEINDQLTVRSFETLHTKGIDNLKNIIFGFEYKDFKIVHLGDLGILPESEVINYVKNADILMIRTGGRTTLSCDETIELISILSPKTVLPIHYLVPKLKKYTNDFTTLDKFLEKISKLNYRLTKLDTHLLDIKPSLFDQKSVIILSPSVNVN